MSLSRTEEMHRLTENVYKVSPAPSARPGPTGAAPGPLGVFSERQRGPGASRSFAGGLRAPRPGSPASPPRAPSARVRAGARGTGPLGPEWSGAGAAGGPGAAPRVALHPGRRDGPVVAPPARLRKPLGTFSSTGFPLPQLLLGQ